MTVLLALGLAWVGLLAIAGLCFARRKRRMLLWLAGARTRRARARERTLRLERAGDLIRMFVSSGPTYAQLETRLAGLVSRDRAQEEALAAVAGRLAGWRGGLGRRRLAAWESAEAAVAAELDALDTALRELADDDRECERHREEIGRLHESLRHAVARHAGWAIDVGQAIAAIGTEIEGADALRARGDGVRALERFRHLRERLHDQRALLDAREATIAWLNGVPGEVERLTAERARLDQAGFRELPPVPYVALCAAGRCARDHLQRGALDEAAREQARLRHQLRQLNEATLGLEAQHDANGRDSAAIRAELAALAGQLATIVRHEARFPKRLWLRASRLEHDVRERLARLEDDLEAAEAHNSLEHQRFLEARTALAALAAALGLARQELGRCATMWQALPREERRLCERFASLRDQSEALIAEARRLGLAPDPGLQALLEATRIALDTVPVALDEVARDLEGVTSALERFAARVGSLGERLSHPAGHPPRLVTVVLHPIVGEESRRDP